MIGKELKAFLLGVSEAALVVDEWGTICGCNEAIEQLLGFSAAELLGTSCADRLKGRIEFDSKVCCERCEVIQCAQSFGRVSSFEMEIHTKLGDLKWVDVSIVVWRDMATRKLFLFHLLRDITFRKQTEQFTNQLLQAATQLSMLPHAQECPPPGAPLTGQERRILQFLAKGKEPDAIACELNISARTLRNHLHNVNQKLHTHNRLEAVMHATHRRLI
jgi:PAS domain S-box-containing protein